MHDECRQIVGSDLSAGSVTIDPSTRVCRAGALSASLISCVILQITTIVLLYIVLAVEQQVAGFGTLIDAFWRTSAQANIPSAITRPPRFSNHCAFQPLQV